MKIATIFFFCFLSSCFQIAGTSLIKVAVNALGFVFIAALILFKALSTGSLSLVTPMFTAINFVFTIIVGKFLFNESMSLAKIAGLLIIIVGVLLVANSEK